MKKTLFIMMIIVLMFCGCKSEPEAEPTPTPTPTLTWDIPSKVEVAPTEYNGTKDGSVQMVKGSTNTFSFTLDPATAVDLLISAESKGGKPFTLVVSKATGDKVSETYAKVENDNGKLKFTVDANNFGDKFWSGAEKLSAKLTIVNSANTASVESKFPLYAEKSIKLYTTAQTSTVTPL